MKSLGAFVLIVVVGLGASACGTSAPAASVARPAASYEEYSVAACAAWDALFRAVGNPDTGSGSELSKALDAAVAAGDAATADRRAAETIAVLRAGRQQVAIAAGWQPRAAVMSQLDRVLAAFEAMTMAKAARARNANALEPQVAFEQAGGVTAWFAMVDAAKAQPAPASAAQCPTVPVTP
jgi:hypothetical protein